jgi:hypothetical protein
MAEQTSSTATEEACGNSREVSWLNGGRYRI